MGALTKSLSLCRYRLSGKLYGGGGVCFCFLTVASFPEDPTEQGLCCSKLKAEWDWERSLPFVTRPSGTAFPVQHHTATAAAPGSHKRPVQRAVPHTPPAEMCCFLCFRRMGSSRPVANLFRDISFCGHCLPPTWFPGSSGPVSEKSWNPRLHSKAV